MTLVEELEKYRAALTEHVQTLENYAKAAATFGLHFLPEMRKTEAGTQIVVNIVNFKDGQMHQTTMEGIPAAFFYEAYREAMHDVFELAIARAAGSVETKAIELKHRLEAEKVAIAEAERDLERFLPPAEQAQPEAASSSVPPPPPPTGIPSKGRKMR